MRRFVKLTAERVLSDRFGTGIRLGGGEMLGRNDRSEVYRFRILSGPDGLPETVVAKQGVCRHEETFDASGGPAERIFNDWAGAQFLNELCGNLISPRFYGGDSDQGLVLVEDLKVGKNLSNLLHEDNAEVAERALVEHARVVGRMHAVTAGKVGAFNKLRNRLGRTSGAGFKIGSLLGTFRELVGVYDSKGISTEAEQDLNTVGASLREPGSFWAYTHNDLGPYNCLWMGDGVKLVDFEAGRFGHARLDALYGPLHFPAFWFTHRIP
ncbi:MAG: hypothetical protein O7G87_00555, partial [bacterium]|nr:hypothetical protein [bacterium]